MSLAISRAFHRVKKSELANATLYSARIGRYHDKKISMPCEHCMEMIMAVGIRRIVYTDYDGNTVPKIIL